MKLLAASLLILFIGSAAAADRMLLALTPTQQLNAQQAAAEQTAQQQKVNTRRLNPPCFTPTSYYPFRYIAAAAAAARAGRVNLPAPCCGPPSLSPCLTTQARRPHPGPPPPRPRRPPPNLPLARPPTFPSPLVDAACCGHPCRLCGVSTSASLCLQGFNAFPDYESCCRPGGMWAQGCTNVNVNVSCWVAGGYWPAQTCKMSNNLTQ